MQTAKPRILLVSPDLSETSSWYRAAGPMSYLVKMGLCEVTMCPPESKIAWPLLVQHDILMILRPAWPSYAYLCRRARELGLKVWVDHDDDLLNLPYHHPEWHYFTSDQTREAVRDCLKAADVVTVTTKNLLTSLSRIKGITENIQVVPNAVDNYMFPVPTPPRDKPNKIIAWRGGNSHAQDLALLKDDVPKLVKDGFRFVFFGMKPAPLADLMPIGTFTHVQPNFAEPDNFLRKLSKLNAPLHFVPLEKNDLNASKSNIAWLEASWLGGSNALASTGISSEWDHATVTDDFHQAALTAIEPSSEVYKACVLNSQSKIREQYLLSEVNKQRAQILRELVG